VADFGRFYIWLSAAGLIEMIYHDHYSDQKAILDDLARGRMVKFMPAEFKLTETRQPPL
jgi:hypothetical protein